MFYIKIVFCIDIFSSRTQTTNLILAKFAPSMYFGSKYTHTRNGYNKMFVPNQAEKGVELINLHFSQKNKQNQC